MKIWTAIKAFFGFPPTPPPAVLGEAGPTASEALRSYVRAPKRRLRSPRAGVYPIVKEKVEDTTFRDVAIGTAIGVAVSHISHHSDNSSSSSDYGNSSSSSDSFSGGGGDFGGGGSSDSF